MKHAYEKEIAKKEQELNDLCAANESSVEKKLQNSIDASERQKEELSSLHKKITNRIESSPQEVRCAFVEDGQVLSKTMSFAEKLELVYRFCKMLAATTEATENIETFITMYEESQKQETLSEILMPTLADIHKQCTEMGDELNVYNGMKQ